MKEERRKVALIISGLFPVLPSTAIVIFFMPWLPIKHKMSFNEALISIGIGIFTLGYYKVFFSGSQWKNFLREATLGEREFFKIFTLFSIPFILYASTSPFVVLYKFGDKENIYNYFISVLVFLASLFSGLAAIKHQWRLANTSSRPNKDDWTNWKPLSFNSAPRRSMRRSKQNIKIKMAEDNKENHDKENLREKEKKDAG